jgi:hypothetical protein
MGALARARLPFANETASPATAATSSLLAALLRRVRTAAATRPDGWKLLRLQPAATGDPRLILAAALFTIELSNW